MWTENKNRKESEYSQQSNYCNIIERCYNTSAMPKNYEHEPRKGVTDMHKIPAVSPGETNPIEDFAFKPSKSTEDMIDANSMEAGYQPTVEDNMLEIINEDPILSNAVKEMKEDAIKEMTGKYAWKNDPNLNPKHPANRKNR